MSHASWTALTLKKETQVRLSVIFSLRFSLRVSDDTVLLPESVRKELGILLFILSVTRFVHMPVCREQECVVALQLPGLFSKLRYQYRLRCPQV